MRQQQGVGEPCGRGCVVLVSMGHLAIPVCDQERSRRFYEAYFGFGARPARRYDDGVLML
jgi:extradiol dioxygenase family protein